MLMEAVAILPLLVALIFGALQMAHIHIARQIVSYAAYAAARATLPLAADEEEEAARKAAQRILCWLVAAPDSSRNGVLMPDPDSRAVKDRILGFNVTQNDWSREIELKFAFPLVMPLAAQIIARRFIHKLRSGKPYFHGHVRRRLRGPTSDFSRADQPAETLYRERVTEC